MRRPPAARRATPPPSREAGFTLLEVLVALVVLGFVVVGLTQGTRFGLRALDRQAARAATAGDLEAVDRLLRRLVAAMDPGNAREPPVVEGGRHALRMVTDLGAAAAALGSGAAEVRLAAEAGRLTLRWTPARHAVSLGPLPSPRRAVLLDGVAGLEIAYWGPPDEEGGPPGWQSAWDRASLPVLVRFRLVSPTGAARRWPDIVAATRLDRDGG